MPRQQLELSVDRIYDRLHTTPEALSNFCEKWQISELALFGSVLREDFRSQGEDASDIDVLFSYLPGANMSLFRRARMKIELESLFGRNVDFLLAIEVLESHNWMRRQQILESTRTVYRCPVRIQAAVETATTESKSTYVG